MKKQTGQFEQALEAIDQANSLDPNTALVDGQVWPKELLYSQRMSECLENFAPDASEALSLTARCQHICRWEIPRADYPATREGYLQWRKQLQIHHANKAGQILETVGYKPELIERVQFLLQKKRLKRDEETQALEDVICLVFLRYYFEPFAQTKTEDKMADILTKTWAKMSAKGQQAALALDYSPSVLSIIKKALG